MNAPRDPSAAAASSARSDDRPGLKLGTAAAANVNRGRRIDPHCPLPTDQPHNSVRAARRGCTCPDGAANHARELARDRAKKKTTQQRHVPAPAAPARADGRPPAGMTLRPPTRLERELHARDDLACRGEDPELFVAVGEGAMTRTQELAAKRICGRCPARDDCSTVALQILPTAGVMGGYSVADRRHLRARSWAA